MKRALAAAVGLVTMLTLIGVRAPAALAYATGTSFPLITVDNGAGYQTEPHVSGHYAAYNVTPLAGEGTIGYFDFATRNSTTVARNLGNVFIGLTASRDGRTIFYTRVDSSVDDLMLVENFR